LYLQYAQKDFHVTAGVVGNVKLGATSRQKYKTEGGSGKSGTGGQHWINPFRVDAEVRVGYKNTQVFATYSLTDMFKKDRGPELQTYSFGISLGIS
jgi:hypothetical protein